MIVTVTSYKGGVGKTTTAVHLACYLSIRHSKGTVLLVDGDPNRSCLAWSKRGKLPFMVVDERAAPRHIRNFEHIIIDTAARPERDELEALADGCDLLVLPTTPDCLSIDALSLTVSTIKTIGLDRDRYKILLTIVPPKPNKDGEEAMELLTEAELPLIKTGIRRLVAFQRAALQGIPVYKVKDPNAKTAWQDYEAVGKEIIP